MRRNVREKKRLIVYAGGQYEEISEKGSRRFINLSACSGLCIEYEAASVPFSDIEQKVHFFSRFDSFLVCSVSCFALFTL